MLVDDIKSICNVLKLKLKLSGSKKEALIDKLLKNCLSQPTLNPQRTPDSILRTLIRDRMGMCVKLSDAFHKIARKLHLLYTGPTTEFLTTSDLYLFLGKVESGEIVMPPVELDIHSVIFSDSDQFSR